MNFNLKRWLRAAFETQTVNRSVRREVRLIVEILEDRLTLDTFLWTGLGNNPNWSNIVNWSVNGEEATRAPGANDDVDFADQNINGPQQSCILDGNAAGTVNSITLYANYVGTITLERTLIVSTAFSMAGGEIAGAFPIELNGGGTWQGGTLAGNGNPSTSTLVIPESKALAVIGNVSLAGRVVQNSGSVLLDTTTITASAGGYINNLSTGTFNQFNGNGTITGQGAFFNYGLVQAPAGTSLNLSVPVTSYQGTFEAEGAIEFNASVTISGGTASLGKAATFVGAGQVLVYATFSVTDPSATTVADFRFFSAPNITSTFAVLDGTTRFLAETTLTGKLMLKTPGQAAGGTVVLAAPLTVSGWDAQVTVEDRSVLQVRNGLTLDSASLSSLGQVWLEGGDIVLDNGASFTSAQLYIGERPNAPFPPPPPPLVPPPAPIGSITGDGTGNFGPIADLSVSDSVTIAFPYEGAGNVRLNYGILTIEGDFSQPAGKRTEFLGGDLWVAGNFQNDGTISILMNGQAFVNTLTNNGLIEFVGLANQRRVDFSILASTFGGGNLTQGANANVSMKLTGNNTNDVLNVAGVATLGGTLNVTILANVNVMPNRSWELINAGTRADHFRYRNQPPGFSKETYKPQSVRVQNPDLLTSATQTTNEDVALTFAPANDNTIGIPAPDAGDALLQIMLTASNGTMTLGTTTGLTFSSGTGSGDVSMRFVGTLDAINAALDGLVFLPTPNFNGSAALDITTTDTPESGGVFSDTDIVLITVNAVNDAPTGTDKTITMTVNTTRTHSAGDFGFLDMVDGHNLLAVTIQPLLLGSLGTLSYNGTAFTETMTIAVADLGLLTYTPPEDETGSARASFLFKVQDDGGTANAGIDTDPMWRTITFSVQQISNDL